MSKTSKAYREAAEKVDRSRLYTPLEAAKLAKETSSKKQDATVEVAIRLGVDPRKADQMVRGTVNLPHGTGKTVRVAVFAVGDKAEQAQAAGADIVGAARAVFLAEGYADVGLTDVAAAGEVSRGLVYRHFPRGRSELFLAVRHACGIAGP